jgi:polysaccharide export outer membrane protein
MSAWVSLAAIVVAIVGLPLIAQSTQPVSTKSPTSVIQLQARNDALPANKMARAPQAAPTTQPLPQIQFTPLRTAPAAAAVPQPNPAAPAADRAIVFAPIQISPWGENGDADTPAQTQVPRQLAASLPSSPPAVALPSVTGTNIQPAGATLAATTPPQAAPADPAIGFRNAERPDPFLRPAPNAFAVSGPVSSASSLQQHASAPRGTQDSLSREADIAISEFRFVNIADDSLRTVSQNQNGRGPLSNGDVATALAQGPYATQGAGNGTGTMPANATGAAGQDSQAVPLPPSQPPAPLADALSEPLPIAGATSFDSLISSGPADPPQLPSGCPYNLGDSGTTTVCGVDCGQLESACSATWNDAGPIPWSLFGPGEYIGPARPEHVSTYYLRVNDLLTLTYITSRRKDAERYRIGVGDRLQLEWLQAPSETDVKLDREVVVQPDGTVSLPLVGDVIADGKTVNELREELIRQFGRYQREPNITVTPMEVNTAIQDILSAVTSVSGANGQTQALRVTPEGTIQAPALGSVFVQGLSLEEARAELEARYAAKFGPGLMVSPSLTERAASFVFVGGEVQAPGRYTLEGPTTVMQAITLAGGWNNGGDLRQVVIFRRDENWCLKATKIDIRAPFFGKDPCPANDVWLRDNDLVVVPKTRILCATDVINLYFTRGVYAAFPINYVYSFNTGSSVTPIITGP